MGEQKRPLQAILMTSSDEQWTSILNGNKKITIREGNRDYQPGHSILCHYKEASLCIGVDITQVDHYKAKNVPKKDFVADGYASREAMITDLKTFYPNLTPESDVTVIRWDNVRGSLLEHFNRQREESQE